MKIIIEIELDQEAYDRQYGPESEWWKKYQNGSEFDETAQKYISVLKPASEYWATKPNAFEDLVQDILSEGFYDWADHGWLDMKINGKAVCKGCGRVEGAEHKDWCERK